MKRMLLTMIALLMMAGMMMAQSYSGGAGLEANPYQIANKADLKYLSENSGEWSKHFKQTENITFEDSDFESDGEFYNSGAGFSPIGNSTTLFTGSYDGDGHTIDNLYINRSGTDYIGLFGSTNNVTISKLGVTNVNITGRNNVGGLVGYSTNNSNVSKSYSTGSVSGTDYVGGLVGKTFNGPTVRDSYSTSSVSGNSNVDGLVGYNYYYTYVRYSYSRGSVSGSSNVGGLVGNNSSATVSNSFWDTQTSGTVTGIGAGTTTGATGKTTDEMKGITANNDLYDDWGWDESIWERVGNNYPRLIDNADQSLPVTLASFTGKYTKTGVILEWETSAEIENSGFVIRRKVEGERSKEEGKTENGIRKNS